MQTRRNWGAAVALAAAIGCTYASADEVLYLDDGRVYRGDVVDGRAHGEGRMIWPSGEVYEGAWVDGVRHGLGEYADPAGARYVGAYVKGYEPDSCRNAR